MNTGLALAIFFNLDREDLSDEEKALAIYTVMNMETHNSVKKDNMLKAIKWLWHRQYEIIEDGEQEEPKKLTNFEKIKAMTVEEMADFISTITSCDDCSCDYCQYHIEDNCPKLYTVDWLNQEVEEND